MVLVHQHPDVLERLLLEIEEVLGERDTVTVEDLDKLRYTEQVQSPCSFGLTSAVFKYVTVCMHAFYY